MTQVPYYKVKIKCKHHRGANGIFEYNAMEGIEEWLKHCMCPRCGRFGTLELLEREEISSYSVDIQ